MPFERLHRLDKTIICFQLIFLRVKNVKMFGKGEKRFLTKDFCCVFVVFRFCQDTSGEILSLRQCWRSNVLRSSFYFVLRCRENLLNQGNYFDSKSITRFYTSNEVP